MQAVRLSEYILFEAHKFHYALCGLYSLRLLLYFALRHSPLFGLLG